jgi:hypothetical protein
VFVKIQRGLIAALPLEALAGACASVPQLARVQGFLVLGLGLAASESPRSTNARIASDFENGGL